LIYFAEKLALKPISIEIVNFFDLAVNLLAAAAAVRPLVNGEAAKVYLLKHKQPGKHSASDSVFLKLFLGVFLRSQPLLLSLHYSPLPFTQLSDFLRSHEFLPAFYCENLVLHIIPFQRIQHFDGLFSFLKHSSNAFIHPS
jgi:hypothetical protein